MNTTHIQLFTYGTIVKYQGREHMVDHVTISGYDLYVHLSDMQHSILSTELECPYTEILLERQNNKNNKN